MEIGFLHNETLPLPVERNFQLGQRCTQERRETPVEKLACALKGILHMAISDDIPLKI